MLAMLSAADRTCIYKLVEIVWDEPKRIANIEKHKLDFADVPVEFFETAVILRARPPRAKAVNWQGGRPMTVIFAPLGTEAISIISYRPAAAMERRALG